MRPQRAGSTDGQDYWQSVAPDEIPSSLELDPVFLRYVNGDASVLELGCGTGKTVFHLSEQGFMSIVGIDLNARAIDQARDESSLTSRTGSVSFCLADARHLPFAAHSFDCIITQAFWTTVTNGEHRHRILQEIVRVLRPGGVMYVADFDQNWSVPLYRERYREGLELGYETGTFVVRDRITGATSYLARHYTRVELLSLLTSAGFDVVFVSFRDVTTRSGNRIRGHIVIGRKRTEPLQRAAPEMT